MISYFKNFFFLIRLDKPIGVFLLFWPTAFGLWVASEGNLEVSVLLVFTAGCFLMRSAGAAVNDFFDQDYDRKVLRTHLRPLAKKDISNTEAIISIIFILLLSLSLLYFLNNMARYAAFFAFILATTYPFAKRFINIPQLYLGACYSMGIVMAFAHYRNAFPIECWILFLGNCFWVLAYDTVYALSDREDDEILGLKSSALYFKGFEKQLIWGCYLFFITLLCLLAFHMSYPLFFYFGNIICFAYILFLMLSTNFKISSDCSKFFKKNHWLGMLIFLNISLVYL